MFDQMKISDQELQAEHDRMKAGFAQRNPGKDFGAFAAQVLAQRLTDRPGLYVEFGPYWWAVKDALRGFGHDLGPADDPVVKAAYSAPTPEHAFVAGEAFKDDYRARYLRGNNAFPLSDDGLYVLEDPDMMARAAAR